MAAGRALARRGPAGISRRTARSTRPRTSSSSPWFLHGGDAARRAKSAGVVVRRDEERRLKKIILPRINLLRSSQLRVPVHYLRADVRARVVLSVVHHENPRADHRRDVPRRRPPHPGLARDVRIFVAARGQRAEQEQQLPHSRAVCFGEEHVSDERVSVARGISCGGSAGVDGFHNTTISLRRYHHDDDDGAQL